MAELVIVVHIAAGLPAVIAEALPVEEAAKAVGRGVNPLFVRPVVDRFRFAAAGERRGP